MFGNLVVVAATAILLVECDYIDDVSAFVPIVPPTLSPPSSRCRILDDGRRRRACSIVARSSSPFPSFSSMRMSALQAMGDTDDDQDGGDDVVGLGDRRRPPRPSSSPSPPSEAALLLPGQRLRIRVGDVSNSRKAWKKRRRNASPILVPCSVLGMDREGMVRGNVLTLLHMLCEEMTATTTTTTTTTNEAGEEDGNGNDGAYAAATFLGTTAGKIGRAYRKRLNGDLTRHAAALGHDTTESLLRHLFDGDDGGGIGGGSRRGRGRGGRNNGDHGGEGNDNNGDGVSTFVESRHGNLVLKMSSDTYPNTKHRARGLSSTAGMVQFRAPNDDDDDDDDDDDNDDNLKTKTMVHTGTASERIPSSIGPGKMPRFVNVPLGAALRVDASSSNGGSGSYVMGDEFDAYVYGYESGGDDGCPLLVLTPSDESRRLRHRRGGGRSVRGDDKMAFGKDWDDAFDDAKGGVGGGAMGSSSTIGGHILAGTTTNAAPLRELSELKVGDGPYVGTVVAVSDRSGAAFVDLGVGRKRGKKYGGGGGGVVGVLGMLRFEDIVFDDGDDDDDDDDVADDSISSAIGDSDDDNIVDDGDFYNVVEAGDEVQVYIKAVSTQSGRFMLTLDSSVGEKKARDRKRERQAKKRKERLFSKRENGRDDDSDNENHGDNDDFIQSLVGNVYDGVVKAKSKTGNWYYVQPTGGEEGEGGGAAILPVGIANFSTESEGSEISVGDHVRVRLDGIDERRGQLALTFMD